MSIPSIFDFRFFDFRLISAGIEQHPDSQNPEHIRGLFTAIAGRYDLANHALSGGLDFLWRRRAARLVGRWKRERILDVATGSGDLALTFQRRFPESKVVGADFCEPMLDRARAKGLQHTVVADALALPFEDGLFDVVSVAFGLRNMASWPGAISEMQRVLEPGGHLLVLDFSIPPPPLRWLYRPYLHHALPRIAGWLTGEKSAYAYLAESIEKFPHGPAMTRLIESRGFSDARCEPLTGGIVSLYTARKG